MVSRVFFFILLYIHIWASSYLWERKNCAELETRACGVQVWYESKSCLIDKFEACAWLISMYESVVPESMDWPIIQFCTHTPAFSSALTALLHHSSTYMICECLDFIGCRPYLHRKKKVSTSSSCWVSGVVTPRPSWCSKLWILTEGVKKQT